MEIEAAKYPPLLDRLAAICKNANNLLYLQVFTAICDLKKLACKVSLSVHFRHLLRHQIIRGVSTLERNSNITNES